MTAPRVSIIMPVHNSEKYLDQCLDSLLAQSERSFELICIDDGSTDSSSDILEKYAKQDNRVRVIHQDCHGAGAARNAGLVFARGTFLSFLDSDDFFDKEMLKSAADRMDATEADIAVFETWIHDTTRNADRLATWYLRWPNVPSSEPFSCHELPNQAFLTFGNCAWNKLFRRSFIEMHGLRFQEISRWNDLLFSCSSLLLADRICTVHRPLIHYRVETGTSLQSTNDLDPLAFNRASSALRDFLVERGLYSEYERGFLNHVIDSVAYSADSLSTTEALSMLKDEVVSKIESRYRLLDKDEAFFLDTRQFEQYKQLCCLPLSEYLLHRAASLKSDRNNLYWLNDWRAWTMAALEKRVDDLDKANKELSEELQWSKDELDRCRQSASYKLGYTLLTPVHIVKGILSRKQ